MQSANTGTSSMRTKVSWLAAVRTDMASAASGELLDAGDGGDQLRSGRRTGGSKAVALLGGHRTGGHGERRRGKEHVGCVQVDEARTRRAPARQIDGPGQGEQLRHH